MKFLIYTLALVNIALFSLAISSGICYLFNSKTVFIVSYPLVFIILGTYNIIKNRQTIK